MDLVGDYDYVRNNGGMHIDAVYDGDKFIGASSGRMLSAKTREMISLYNRSGLCCRRQNCRGSVG